MTNLKSSNIKVKKKSDNFFETNHMAVLSSCYDLLQE